MINANLKDLMTTIAVCRVSGTTNIKVDYDRRVKYVNYFGSGDLNIGEHTLDISECINNLVDLEMFGQLPEVPLQFRFNLESSELNIFQFDPDQLFGVSVRMLVF